MKQISEFILLTAVSVVQDFPRKIRATEWKIDLKNLIIIVVKSPQSMFEELSKNNKSFYKSSVILNFLFYLSTLRWCW